MDIRAKTVEHLGVQDMIIRNEYIIDGRLLQEALTYADLSGAYTSDRHDFHAGGLNNKKMKMFEGNFDGKGAKIAIFASRFNAFIT